MEICDYEKHLIKNKPTKDDVINSNSDSIILRGYPLTYKVKKFTKIKNKYKFTVDIFSPCGKIDSGREMYLEEME